MVRNTLIAFASLSLAVACGGSSFVAEETGGTAGQGGSNGGSSQTGGTGTGGRGGSTGTGGANTGGANTGGSNTGGTGTGGSSGSGVGGSGASGGSTGGDGSGGDAGSGGSGVGGSITGGAGGSTGGSIGTGGLAGAGTGGDAGAAGCGICPFIACAPPFWLTVMASDQAGIIQDLTIDAPEELGIECFANGGVPCQWSCQSYAPNAPAGNYEITISAPGFGSKSISFEVAEPQNCGCCGCGCQNYYQGEVKLDASGEVDGACCANTRTDPANCGSCGNVCANTLCTNGMCTM